MADVPPMKVAAAAAALQTSAILQGPDGRPLDPESAAAIARIALQAVDPDPVDGGTSHPICWWPFADAPEELRHHDNGGDEDWVILIPPGHLEFPLPRCDVHGRVWADWHTCEQCDEYRDEPPQIASRNHPTFDRFAVAGWTAYEQPDGSVVVITHHS